MAPMNSKHPVNCELKSHLNAPIPQPLYHLDAGSPVQRSISQNAEFGRKVYILSLSHYQIADLCFDWQSWSVKRELPEQCSEVVTDHSSASQCEEKWRFCERLRESSSKPRGTGFPLMRNQTNAESDAGSVSHSSGIELQMPGASPVRHCP